jgi:putative sugar O-methyltransferase
MPIEKPYASTQTDDIRARSEAMLKELAGSPQFLPSAFWSELNQKNIEMLEAQGLEDFKRTISQNYYNWLVTSPAHVMFRHALLRWLRRPNILPFRTRLADISQLRVTTSENPVALSWFQQQVYRVYVSLVWDIMLKADRHQLHRHLSEPTLGNPIRVRNGAELITQDLANSILECNAIADLAGTSTRPRVAEFGAGYGRTAYAYAATQPGQYFIFDIPPALAVAQWYLQKSLGAERVFAFQSIDRFEDVADRMERASVVMLTPNQLLKFPPAYFDVIVSISTLPEMSPVQVNMYLDLFRRYSRKSIFLKQWKRWRNPADGTDLDVGSYAFDETWRVVLDQTDPINPMFFNRAWERVDAAQ